MMVIERTLRTVKKTTLCVYEIAMLASLFRKLAAVTASFCFLCFSLLQFNKVTHSVSGIILRINLCDLRYNNHVISFALRL